MGLAERGEIAMEAIAREKNCELAAPNSSACLWLCSKLSRSDDGISKPESDDGSKITAKNQITAETAAEIAVETSDREMSDGDEMAVWVWQPGDVAGAKEYFVRVSWSCSFSARLNVQVEAR